jgi:hypothetical protein
MVFESYYLLGLDANGVNRGPLTEGQLNDPEGQENRQNRFDVNRWHVWVPLDFCFLCEI